MSKNKDLTKLSFTRLFIDHDSLSTQLKYVYKEGNLQIEKLGTEIVSQRKHIDALRSAGHFTQQYESRLERSVEELALYKRRIDVNEVELTSKLQIIVAELYGLFRDLESDYQQGFLSHLEYQNYLKQYSLVLENTNGLKLYEVSPVERIREAITLQLAS